MHGVGERHVSERIPGNAIRTALQEDELGRLRLKVRKHLGPDHRKRRIVRPRRQRDIELGPARGAATDLVRASSAGVEVATILVQVGEDHAGVVLETVIHPIAVVGIDVDVGDATEPMLLT